MRRRSEKILFYTCLLLLWQVVYSLHIWPPYLFPSPQGMVEALRSGLADGSIATAVGVSLRRIAIGYSVAVVVGVLLGLAIATSEFLQSTIGTLVLSLQSLPSVCWLPFAVLWFGLSENAIIFVVLIGSVLSITINAESGVRNLPKLYLLAGRNLGARGPRLFWNVLLPASLPYLVSGLKQGWAFAWRSLISGEMIFVSLGLGHLLMMGRDLNDMSQVLAVMALIMLLGYLVDRIIFVNVERRIRERWGLATSV